MLRPRRPLLKTKRGRGVRSRSRYTWMLANRSGRGSSNSRRGRIDGVRGGRCRYRGRSGGGDVGGLSMLGSSLFLRWRRFRAVRRTLFARPLTRARSLIRASTTRLSVVHTFVVAPEAVVAFCGTQRACIASTGAKAGKQQTTRRISKRVGDRATVAGSSKRCGVYWYRVEKRMNMGMNEEEMEIDGRLLPGRWGG